MSKPILCLDFDGVIHSYSSGWKGADIIPDPPVLGALDFIERALEHFRIAIYSSRSGQPGGIEAMKDWLRGNFGNHIAVRDGIPEAVRAITIVNDYIEWPIQKPSAFITLDDRALTFEGTWPSIKELKEFKPWNKREFGATGEFPHGKLNEDDEGALKIGIAYDSYIDTVRIDFGKKVAWLGLPPEQAIEFAKAIMRKAGAKKIEVEF